MGTLGGMGPGMLPKALAVLLGLLGALLAAEFASSRTGARLEPLVDPRPAVRARRARGCSASPCARSAWSSPGRSRSSIGAFASDEVRWSETLVFGALMTAFCIGLFKFALGLPIPLAPWLLGY